MSIFKTLHETIVKELEDMAVNGDLPTGLDMSKVTAEPPRDPSHGDIATNAAMVLAKPAGLKPRDLAGKLVGRLAASPGVVEADIAGPGFVNLRLGDDLWRDELRSLLVAGIDYGRSDIGASRPPVNVEFVSANPTGPLHIGHARGAVFGDALASLLEFAGYKVHREYYVNDAGAQVDVLARSAYLRYREALGEEIGEIPSGLYPGDYLKPVGAALAETHGKALLDKPEEDWLPVVRQTAIDAMLDLIREDLHALAIHHDTFSSERAMVESGGVERALATLEERGLIYTGVLEPPKGKVPEDWEPRPQTLFRSTEFGDDVDRPIKKSDGSWTYFASDIAYHLDKVVDSGGQRGVGCPALIDVLGADHGGYVKRMQAAVQAITDGKGSLHVKLCQLVKLLDQGEPVKMSKRSGSFVTLRDVLDEVGPDALRFTMLTRRNDQVLDFDFHEVRKQSRDNPVYYVQYAHARVKSVLRHAGDLLPDLDLSPEGLAGADLSRLDRPLELALIKLLAGWPRAVEAAALAEEPHRIAFYLQDVAGAFHTLWHEGNTDADLRFLLPDDAELSRARLALIVGVATVIASGLRLFGVRPVEEMR